MSETDFPDYQHTILLPKTDFPMRAGLPKKEEALLARWERVGLQERLRRAGRERPKFVLHDGPPYANGELHIGHALNKILKDIVNRSRQMSGFDAAYIPGWDCHGLPIEWKIEEDLRARGRNKDTVPILEFRALCRDFARKWVNIQRDGFQRMGVMADWKNPYLTMTYEAEAAIAEEIGKFLLNGSLFEGTKPVLWSVVERTALAEAEIEYKQYRSRTLYVRFPVVRASVPEIAGSGIVIWTTTGWTLPGNRAIACHSEQDYAVVEPTSTENGDVLRAGEKLVVAESLLPSLCKAMGGRDMRVLHRLKGTQIEGTLCAHPLYAHGYGFDVPVGTADFVTDEQGTGFVHVAPGHGVDDFLFGQKLGLENPPTIGADGIFYGHVPLFGGLAVYNSDGSLGPAVERIVDALRTHTRHLLAEGGIEHSYPHSWRSKAPLIFRNTRQWFISMEEGALRQRALKALEGVQFIPETGRARLSGMIAERPDWCVSRQRVWGVPLPIFVQKESRTPLRDPEIIQKIVEIFKKEGADAWYQSPMERFLSPKYDPEQYEKINDIIDVWFESGSTHAFVLEKRGLPPPADLYLEGSDQHRGWFHSSLLESCGTRGQAPYKSVLTHGFALDAHGRKMSKSLGNIVAPQEVISAHGAEILRIWVAATDYGGDLRISPEILKRHVDSYRRIRNTLRWLLGNLGQNNESATIDSLDSPSALPELERYVLHRLYETDRQLREAAKACEFRHCYKWLYDFCNGTLSSLYFDIRKDALYCDEAHGATRQASLKILAHVFDFLATRFAPILCFTAEEAWLARYGDKDNVSVHLQQWRPLPQNWQNEALAAKWQRILDIRRVLTGGLELMRNKGEIGSSLEADSVLRFDAADSGHRRDRDLLTAAEWAEIAIVSNLHFADACPEDWLETRALSFQLEDVPGIRVEFRRAKGEKCPRCWKLTLPENKNTDLCRRCAAVLRGIAA